MASRRLRIPHGGPDAGAHRHGHALCDRRACRAEAQDTGRINFYSFIHPLIAEEQKSRSKAEIVQLLRTSGDQFAKWLEGLSDAFLAEQVSFPAGAQPPAKTRFEMLLSLKNMRCIIAPSSWYCSACWASRRI